MFVLALVIGLVWLFAMGLGRDPRIVPSALLDKPAPDFSLRTIEGDRTIRLSDLRGQVVVLNFWATWCSACRLEHFNFVRAWERYRDKGVVFVGVLFQDSPEAAHQYMRDLGGDWPNVMDPGTRTAQRYGVFGVPETFFIGPDGRIAHKQIGYTSYELLVEQVERLLGTRGSA